MKRSVHAALKVLGAAAFVLVDPVFAQAAGQTSSAATHVTGRPDPLDAAANVPQTIYRSPLAQYRVLRDEKVGSWKDANDEVDRIGGWRAYAREASAPESTPGKAGDAPRPAQGGMHPSAPGSSGGHSGHMQK